MTNLPKGMTTEEASLARIAGHVNENDCARLIGGTVSAADPAGKKDVMDRQQRMRSVKPGRKWQMFLCSRSRLTANAMLRGLGNVASCSVACLDSQPQVRSCREANKASAKAALQAPMRELRDLLDDSRLLPAFFLKAMFEDSQVEYLAILPPDIYQRAARPDEKFFHVFDAREAVEAICSAIAVVNSKAGNLTQTDDQKVVFRTTRNIGEIELRTHPQNHRRVKMWTDARPTLSLLQDSLPCERSIGAQVHLHGKASRLGQSYVNCAIANCRMPEGGAGAPMKNRARARPSMFLSQFRQGAFRLARNVMRIRPSLARPVRSRIEHPRAKADDREMPPGSSQGFRDHAGTEPSGDRGAGGAGFWRRRGPPLHPAADRFVPVATPPLLTLARPWPTQPF